MANPQYGQFPNADGWQGVSPRIQYGLAWAYVNDFEFADKANINGRYDFVGPVYRGDLLSPQFLMRPILIRAAQQTQPQRGGVVTEIATPNAPSSTLDRIRANIR